MRRSTCRPGSSASATAAGPHAPDDFYVIEAGNPKVAGLDRVVASYVEFLYSLA